MQRPGRTYIVVAAPAMAVPAVLVVRQVGEDGGSGQSSSTAQPPGKYTQTWSKQYAATTCTDWTSLMTDPQKFAASTDMLLGARKVDGGAGLPGDALVNEFTSGITTRLRHPCDEAHGRCGGSLAD